MNEAREYVRNQIIKLKDDLQHYTMVEKDSVMTSQIKYDLDMFDAIEQTLDQAEKVREILKNKNYLTNEYITGTVLVDTTFTKEEISLIKEWLEK